MACATWRPMARMSSGSSLRVREIFAQGKEASSGLSPIVLGLIQNPAWKTDGSLTPFLFFLHVVQL